MVFYKCYPNRPYENEVEKEFSEATKNYNIESRGKLKIDRIMASHVDSGSDFQFFAKDKWFALIEFEGALAN